MGSGGGGVCPGVLFEGGCVCVDVEMLPRPLLLWCVVALSLIT